jgi:hypothetical protein
MAETIDIALTHWRVTTTHKGDETRDFLVGDGELAACVTKLAIHPEVTDVRFQRYLGPPPQPERPTARSEPERPTARSEPAEPGDVTDGIGIRCAAADVSARVDALRRVIGWPYMEFEHRADRAERRVRAALAELPGDADPAALAETIRPLMDEYWPASGTPLTVAVSEAVERLREVVAQSRPPAGVTPLPRRVRLVPRQRAA